MKLYGNPMSTCTRRVLATLAEKGAAADFINIDLEKKEQKSPEYLKRHPFGVVPVLEDEDFVLYESRAIIRYLDGKLRGPAMQPTDLRERARMEQWMQIEQSYFSGPAMTIIMAKRAQSRGQPTDEAKVAEARPKVAHALDVADQRLAKNEYLAGPAFTLAEITWMPYLEYLAATAGDLITSRANVNRWWEQIRKRPSWQKVIAK